MDNQIESNTDQLLDPKELAAAFEHTMNFVKGDTDALPDMMAHTGRLLLKLSRRLSTTQMVLLVGALTLGAVFVAKRVEEALDDDDDENQRHRQTRALPGGGGNRQGASASAAPGGSEKKERNAGTSGNQESQPENHNSGSANKKTTGAKSASK